MLLKVVIRNLGIVIEDTIPKFLNDEQTLEILQTKKHAGKFYIALTQLAFSIS